jgi:hypothetical protein
VVTNNSGPARVYLGRHRDQLRGGGAEEGQGGRHWLGLRLLDRHGRDALGAWVTVKAGDLELHRRVTTGGGYVSARDPRLLFGLGEMPPRAPLTVSVRWPSLGAADSEGIGREIHEHFSIETLDGYLTLQEGDGEKID